jgi:hypothetical protein
MGRRRNGSGRSLVLVLFVTLAGCGGGAPVARGFGSREVQAVLDSTVSLSYVVDVQGQDPTLVYTTLPDILGGYEYWSLDLTTGARQDVGANPPSSGTTPPPPTDRYTCVTADLMQDGTETLEVTDTTTGVKTDITGITSFPACVHDDGTLSVFRLDPDTGKQFLASGPYQQLVPVTLPFDIVAIEYYRFDSTERPAQVVVLGSLPGQPNAPGIYSIDLTTNTSQPLLPAVPASTAWATGAVQAGSLQSNAVAPDVQVLPYNGHYFYGRKMSDGGTTLFAGPFTSGPASELALYQLSADGTPVLPSGVRVGAPDDVTPRPPAAPVRGWQVDGAGGAPSQLIVWDDASQQVTACLSSPGAYQSGVTSPDGTHVLFRALQLGGQLTIAPLQLLTLGGAGQPDSCVSLQDSNVMWADFSGDGSTIAWLVTNDGGLNGQLWTANSDGTDPKMILSGQMLLARFITGTSHLEMSYSGDLVWLDVRDPTGFTHVAEQLFGQPTAVGGSWFVAGYTYSGQDASGVLGVVDLDTGAKRPISPAVSQYLVVPQTVPIDGGAPSDQTPTGLYHVVYVVRGRNPSPQDGIWVATVQAADLQ